ncbi:unnamed protein product, partial [Amoebophrya sp. A25]
SSVQRVLERYERVLREQKSVGSSATTSSVSVQQGTRKTAPRDSISKASPQHQKHQTTPKVDSHQGKWITGGTKVASPTWTKQHIQKTRFVVHQNLHSCNSNEAPPEAIPDEGSLENDSAVLSKNAPANVEVSVLSQLNPDGGVNASSVLTYSQSELAFAEPVETQITEADGGGGPPTSTTVPKDESKKDAADDPSALIMRRNESEKVGKHKQADHADIADDIAPFSLAEEGSLDAQTGKSSLMRTASEQFSFVFRSFVNDSMFSAGQEEEKGAEARLDQESEDAQEEERKVLRDEECSGASKSLSHKDQVVDGGEYLPAPEMSGGFRSVKTAVPTTSSASPTSAICRNNTASLAGNTNLASPPTRSRSEFLSGRDIFLMNSAGKMVNSMLSPIQPLSSRSENPEQEQRLGDVESLRRLEPATSSSSRAPKASSSPSGAQPVISSRDEDQLNKGRGFSPPVEASSFALGFAPVETAAPFSLAARRPTASGSSNNFPSPFSEEDWSQRSSTKAASATPSPIDPSSFFGKSKRQILRNVLSSSGGRDRPSNVESFEQRSRGQLSPVQPRSSRVGPSATTSRSPVLRREQSPGEQLNRLAQRHNLLRCCQHRTVRPPAIGKVTLSIASSARFIQQLIRQWKQL